MQFQYNPYIWPLIASALISLCLGIYALIKRRKTKGSPYFILLMFLVVVWTIGNALEISAANFFTKLFWANLQYISYSYAPVTILALCMEFSGYNRWIRNKRILKWLAIFPTVIVILVWTDPLFGLIRYDMHLDYSGLFPVIAKNYGFLFFIHAFYAYALDLCAWLLLIAALISKKSIYRKQALALFLGLSLTFLPNIIYVLGLSPLQGFDVTPMLFGPANLIIALGIYRFKLLDVLPVARATVIETMDAGVLILDLQNRVLDVNPAFVKILSSTADKILAKPASEVCAQIPELVDACTGLNTNQKEFSITTNGLKKVYELLISPLQDHQGKLIGRLIVFYDISAKKQAQQEFLQQQWKLAATEERMRQARDLHDNLGQLLGFINLQAQGIKQELLNSGIDIASQKFDKLVGVVQAAHQEIREYIKNARTSEFADNNFINLLQKDIEFFEEQTDLNVILDLPKQLTGKELTPNVQLNLLNIIRESLNNIRKHAAASHVKISIKVAKDLLCLAVEDDGKGFDIKSLLNVTKAKFGLDIMRERASQIGARIDVKSEIGRGTRIHFSLALKEGDHKSG